MNSISAIVFLSITVLSLVSGHSQMRCAKYDIAKGTCSAPIRNEGVATIEESYRFNGGSNGPCNSRMSNPISASYSNGAACPDWAPCPGAMGTYAPGEAFTVMWWARNHAVADQTPATVSVYMSSLESQNQGTDFTMQQLQTNLLCRGPYMNCGGINQDKNPCTLACTMPANTATGIYTLLWRWDWQGDIFTTCSDIYVSGGATNPPSPTPATTAAKPATTGIPVTTGAAQQQGTTTTGPRTTTTTGSRTTTTGARTSTTTGNPKPADPVTTGAKPANTTGTNAPAMCYLPGTKNLGGQINNNGWCGAKSPRARCADGQCCSQYGYCGPFAEGDGKYYQYNADGSKVVVTQEYAISLYCSKTSTGGDYRKVPCSTVQTGIPASAALLDRSGSSILATQGVMLLGIILGAFLLF